MMDARRELRLLSKARRRLVLTREVVVENLDRNVAAQHTVAPAVDDTGCAPAEYGSQLVAPREQDVVDGEQIGMLRDVVPDGLVRQSGRARPITSAGGAVYHRVGLRLRVARTGCPIVHFLIHRHLRYPSQGIPRRWPELTRADCMVESPQVGRTVAWRLPRPPHTTMTNCFGEACMTTRPPGSTRPFSSSVVRTAAGQASMGCHAWR